MTTQRSPLAAAHESLGARFVDFGGWEMPISYPAGTVAEHRACRSAAVAFDVSHLGTVRVEGRDAFERLQRSLDFVGLDRFQTVLENALKDSTRGRRSAAARATSRC